MLASGATRTGDGRFTYESGCLVLCRTCGVGMEITLINQLYD